MTVPGEHGDELLRTLFERVVVITPREYIAQKTALVTRQAITRHLHALGDAGLVRNARRGRERVWELDLKRLERAQRCLDQIAAQWDDAAARLKAFVEDH